MTKITLDTPLKDLELSIRLRNALFNEHLRVHGSYTERPPTVGDFVHLSDGELMRIPNLGRKSVREWDTVVRRATNSRSPVVEEEEEAEEHALKKIRVHLNNIAGAHSALAAHYKKLADIICPVH